MSRRNNLDRCAICRMHQTVCICDRIPQLETRTRLALVLHHREVPRPTNTGTLAAKCLARSVVTVFGERDRPTTLPAIEPGEQPLLLYPADDAVPIENFVRGAPVVLFVPDGSWRQAHKMRRRMPGLDQIPCVVLPELGHTNYRLRAEHHEGGLATLEAIARALRILEGDRGEAIEAALLEVFRLMVDRTLWLRGRLSDDQAEIPQAARDAKARGTPARRG